MSAHRRVVRALADTWVSWLQVSVLYRQQTVTLLDVWDMWIQKYIWQVRQLPQQVPLPVKSQSHPNLACKKWRKLIVKALGKVFKYGDNVDTDVIIPARYLNSSDPAELATHCMEDIDKDFVNQVKKGDIIVAEKNFGCGSSREHAPIAIKASGVSCVIAETFARIFYRNSINIGLPIIECKEASERIEAGDEVEIDFDSGIITNKTKGESYKGQAFPEFMQKIIKAEGLMNYINAKEA